MGEVIDFPGSAAADKDLKQEELTQDPYYLFIRNVLSTADSCGFQLPFTLDNAAEHVYEKTRHTSQLAKLLEKNNP